MKIQRFDERNKYVKRNGQWVSEPDISNEEDIILDIEDIILKNPGKHFSDSREAAEKILKYMKDVGVDFDLLFSTKKYNL